MDVYDNIVGASSCVPSTSEPSRLVFLLVGALEGPPLEGTSLPTYKLKSLSDDGGADSAPEVDPDAAAPSDSDSDASPANTPLAPTGAAGTAGPAGAGSDAGASLYSNLSGLGPPTNKCFRRALSQFPSSSYWASFKYPSRERMFEYKNDTNRLNSKIDSFVKLRSFSTLYNSSRSRI